MIEVEIPKDINGYKPKFIGPLTLRNTVSIIITAITAVPIGFLLGQVFVNEIALTIAMIIGAPILFCGFKDIYGMPAEKFILMYLKTHLGLAYLFATLMFHEAMKVYLLQPLH